MRVGSLFSGLGGLDLGLPGDPAWLCEYDQHARRVLEHRFPGVPVYPDVRELDDTVPPVDMLIGGYPCQPFSVAGKRGAERDPRHLWPEFARLIRVLRPSVVVAENVSGHLALGFDRVLCDLAEAGFDAEWVVVRASDVGAPHRRERLFIVAADATGVRRDRWEDRPCGRGERVEATERCQGEQDAWNDGGAAADASDERRDGHVPSRPAGEHGQHRDENRETPSDADVRAGRRRRRTPGGPGSRADETPAADTNGDGFARERRQQPVGRDADGRDRPHVAWGAYEPAIRRWEHTIGRPAPRPTDDRGRLNPVFVEWMMGLPHGWVTDPALGVSRTQQLRMLGNAVVPQQAALAWSILAAEAAA